MRALPVVWVSLFLSASAFGQGLQPISYTSAPAKQQQEAPAPTLRAIANLVVVDVVVRDRAGKPIRGLKREDFALMEDKVAQPVENFEEHSSADIVPSALRSLLPKDVFTNIEATSAKGPLNVLLFDKFNTEPHDQANLRLQLLKFIDAAKPGTRMALLELGDHLTVLQGFTDDHQLLKLALRDRDKPLLAHFDANTDMLELQPPTCDPSGVSTPGFCVPLGGDLAPGQLTASAIEAPYACSPGAEKDRQCMAGCDTRLLGQPGPKGIKLQVACQQLLQRSTTMAATLDFLAVYLGNLPGRKNLLWFSGSFPFALFPTPLDGTGVLPVQGFRRTVDKFRASQVAIYPMGDHLPVNPDKVWQLGPPTDDMNELARETGGKAFNNPSSLDEDTAAAIEDGSNYYTLTYRPLDKEWNGRYRKIDVALSKGQTAELSFRQGYFANDPAKPLKTAIFGKGKAPNDEKRPGNMQMALMLGAPAMAGISFVTRPVAASNTAEQELAEGNEGSKGLKGPYKRYTARLGVDVTTLTLRQAGGRRQGEMEYVVFVYNAKGDVVNSAGKTAKLDLTDAQYTRMLHDGLPVQLDVSVPVNGDYTLRIAVHDLADDRVGSVEVPMASLIGSAVAAK